MYSDKRKPEQKVRRVLVETHFENSSIYWSHDTKLFLLFLKLGLAKQIDIQYIIIYFQKITLEQKKNEKKKIPQGRRAYYKVLCITVTWHNS